MSQIKEEYKSFKDMDWFFDKIPEKTLKAFEEIQSRLIKSIEKMMSAENYADTKE
jgi:hypothetical protein